MSYELIDISIEKKVATLKIDRPKALNALCDQLIVEMTDVLDGLENNPDVSALILTGGTDVFAAGADLKEMAEKTFAEVITQNFSGCCHRLGKFELPVIAAVAGYALGGGCELVEMCDIVIAAETAKFGHGRINFQVHH